MKNINLLIGRIGTLRSADGLRVGVRVEDARANYGRVDLLVKPLNGWSTAWVRRARVVLDKKEG